MINKILLTILALVVLGLIIVMRPVPKVAEEEALIVTGSVSYVSQGGVKDIIIRIQDDPRIFYINRAVDKGMNVNEMKERLLGKQVTIKYPEYWNPVDWNSQTRHISKLEVDNDVIFNELK